MKNKLYTTIIIFISFISFTSIFCNEAKITVRHFCTDSEWTELWLAYNKLFSIEKENKSPLYFALELKKNDIAKELVYVYGYEAFPDLLKCLRESISQDFDELPLLMIAQGLDPSFGRSLLLSFAAKWGREQLLLELLSLGVNPNSRPTYAWPALNELASNSKSASKESVEQKKSNIRMAEALIASGADINGESSPGNGHTPLYIACSSCYGPDFDFVQFLLNEGADSNILENSSKATPFLHLFSMCAQYNKCFWTQDCLGSIKLFIEMGVDVNLKDKEGNTALIYLLQKPPGNNKISIEILRILLESGADLLLAGLVPLNTCHRDWLTPMEYARAHGFEEHHKYMIEFLIEHSDPWIRYRSKIMSF